MTTTSNGVIYKMNTKLYLIILVITNRLNRFVINISTKNKLIVIHDINCEGKVLLQYLKG